MVREPLMTGFPPSGEGLVTLANWQEPPYNQWSFQHLRELIPTQRIPRGPGPARALDHRPDAPELDDVPVARVGGGESTFADVVADTSTDAVVVLHRGQLAYERYHDDMAAQSTHLMMSVSKSVVGCVAGILLDRGVLAATDEVVRLLPELAGSGYDKSTVRDVLDMRTGVAFREQYTDPDAEVRVMERHMGWRPVAEGGDQTGMYAYLATLGAGGEHGGRFVYRSADTDVLGWVCERASGVRMAELISELIWQPMGAEFDAEITCDCVGTAIHDGGMSARARDLARFGQLLLDDGRVGSAQVVPERWLVQARTLDPDIRGAFAASDSEPVLRGGWYRNQFWFVPGPLGDLQLCLGIHGQLVLVDRASRTVGVKLSSWPTAQDAAHLLDTISAFVAVGRRLAGIERAPVERAAPARPVSVVTGR